MKTTNPAEQRVWDAKKRLEGRFSEALHHAKRDGFDPDGLASKLAEDATHELWKVADLEF